MSSTYRVPPFGHPGISGYLLLHPAFRSLSRPSSPPRATGIPRALLIDFLVSSFKLYLRPPLPRRSSLRLIRAVLPDGSLFFSYMSLSSVCQVPLAGTLPRGGPTGVSPVRALSKRSGRDSVETRSAPFVSAGPHGPASRKEVFQPHLPVRLPCYDLAPITRFTLGRSSRSRTSGTPNFHGLTGGVYKARERIHRAMADARLLANPTSRSRVADSDPN